jgi:SIR2-like domain
MQNNEPSLQELLVQGSTGKAILFCGAGASLGAINFDVKNLPSSNPLLTKINTHLSKNYSRLDIAASKLAETSLIDYYKMITNTYRVSGTIPEYDEVIGFPWKRIYTTNYDNAAEFAASKIKKKFFSYSQKDHPRDIIPQVLPIIHLHGFIDRFTLDNITDDCILDYNSNVANGVYEGPWSTELKNDISTADIIVFLGYSLYDPEIARIILRGNVSAKKIFFINSKNSNDELTYMQSRFGIPLPIEVDGLARIVAEVTAKASTSPRTNFVCFEPARTQQVKSKSVTNINLSDLFLYGDLDESLLQTDIVSETQKYIILPDYTAQVLNAIKSGHDLVMVFSPLGHGKSVFAKICAAAIAKSRVVFSAIRDQPEFLEEFKYIIHNYNNPVFVFDDYYKYVRHQQELANLKSGSATFIFTSRLNIYENRRDELTSLFLNHKIAEVRIGDISQSDAKSLVPLIDQAGLWFDKGSKNFQEKVSILTARDGRSSQANFADILVGLMSSREMIDRIKKELSVLRELSFDAYRCVLLSIYLEFTNNHVSEFIMDQALGYSMSSKIQSEGASEIFRIFLRQGNSGRYFRGSVFAKYAIESVCESNDLLSTIGFAAGKLARLRSESTESKSILIDLLRFNYLKAVAKTDKTKLSLISEMYADLSKESRLNTDDLFWNAYGMCEREMQNFETAIRYFRNGIKYAEIKGARYIPYHAQNQLILCLLERAVSVDLPLEEISTNGLEIIGLLQAQADDERSYGGGQAFSWYNELKDFLDMHYLNFSQPQKARHYSSLVKYVKFIKSSVAGWSNREKASRMVSMIEGFLLRVGPPTS